jgi:hypothetical protein
MTVILDVSNTAIAGMQGRAKRVKKQNGKLFAKPNHANSAKNILLWNSYLPHDCVKSMINMGWDHST